MLIARLYFPLILVSLLSSCGSNDVAETSSTKDTLAPDTNNSPGPLKPVFGYRFVLEGDFNGDGKKETLTEHYFSAKEGKETNKFYEDIPYDSLVGLTIKKEPSSFVTFSDHSLDTLFISDASQLLGIIFMKNEGDLDGDGGDELSYVIHWADWSNVNTCHLISWKKNKWVELYSFGMWEWQLPELPATSRAYSLAGQYDLAVTGSDSITQVMEQEMNAFPGLIRKIGENKIEVLTKNEESELDTLIIDLRNPPQQN